MIRKLFGVLLALIVALVVIGFLLPTTVVIERSRLIDRPPEQLFAVLSDLRHFARWAPWLAREPQPSWRLEGPEQGVGATLVWRETADSPESRLRIVGVQADERVDLAIEMADTSFESWFRIDPDASAEGQRVSWGMRADFGALDLVGRYVGVFLPSLVGRNYDEGLERLEDYLVESPGRLPALPDAES